MAVTPLVDLVPDGDLVRVGVGTVRTSPAATRLNFALLRRACAQPNILWNPNSSLGASVVIRELLIQMGLPFAVLRERGSSLGYSAGNALLIGAPNAAGNPDGALAALAQALQTATYLFTRVAHYSEYSDEALRYGSVSDTLYNSTGQTIYLEATLQSLALALSTSYASTVEENLSSQLMTGSAFLNRSVQFAGRAGGQAFGGAATAGVSTVGFW